MNLPAFPVQQSSLKVFSLENNQNLSASEWQSWQRQEDFVASDAETFITCLIRQAAKSLW